MTRRQERSDDAVHTARVRVHMSTFYLKCCTVCTRHTRVRRPADPDKDETRARARAARGGCISISATNVHFHETLHRDPHTQPRPPTARVYHSCRWQGEGCVLIWPFRPSQRS